MLSFSFWLKAQPAYPYGYPLGSRNQLGVYSPLSIAAGETILSQIGPQAAFLNPGLLGLVDDFYLAISGRLIHAFTENSYNYDNLWTDYSRDTLNPDFSGLALKSGDWRFGLGYSLLEEYNRPEIMVYGDSDTQDGKLRAIQLGISRRVNDHFSLGLSFNYRWGKLERSEYNDYSSYITEYQVDLNGFNLQFGLVWNLNSNLTLGLVIRPAYRMKVDGIREEKYSGIVSYYSHFKAFLTYPLALGFNSRVKISENLNLYSDLFYWNWKQFSVENNYSYDLRNLYDWPQGHNAIKFSSGLIYGRNLGSETKILYLAAGYVHDPYVFYNTIKINDHFTFGLALSLKKFGLEGSVKLPLARIRDSSYIDSSSYSFGLSFRL